MHEFLRVPLVDAAYRFAAAAHARVGQLRKYTGAPYIEHPLAVAETVAGVPHTPEQLAAALLHDTVEDTGVQLSEIERLFGPVVRDYIWFLTDVSRPGDGKRAVRKAIDRAHIALAPPQVKTIKLADIISNVSSILEHDRRFARTYLPENTALLKVLQECDPLLWEQAHRLVRSGMRKLRIR